MDGEGGHRRGEVIADEAMFKALVHGDEVDEMAEKILELGLKMQKEKRRILGRDLRIEYLKKVEKQRLNSLLPRRRLLEKLESWRRR